MVSIRINSGEDSPVELIPQSCYIAVRAREQLIDEVRRRGGCDPFPSVYT